MNAALRSLAAQYAGTFDSRCETLLGLPHEESRLRHRYLADALR